MEKIKRKYVLWESFYGKKADTKQIRGDLNGKEMSCL
jgi:hypothetical protein